MENGNNNTIIHENELSTRNIAVYAQQETRWNIYILTLPLDGDPSSYLLRTRKTPLNAANFTVILVIQRANLTELCDITIQIIIEMKSKCEMIFFIQSALLDATNLIDGNIF